MTALTNRLHWRDMKTLPLLGFCFIAACAFAEPRVTPYGAIAGSVAVGGWTAPANAVTDIAVAEVEGANTGDVVAVQQNGLGVMMLGRVTAPNQVTISVSNPSKQPVAVVNQGHRINFYVVRFAWPDPR